MLEFFIITVRTGWERATAKSALQFFRYIFTRIWPLSYLGQWYYAVWFSNAARYRKNRIARESYRRQEEGLTDSESKALSTLKTDGVYLDQENLLFSLREVEKLNAAVTPIWNKAPITRQIENRKSINGAKWYVIRAFGKHPPPLPIEFQDIIFSKRLLNVVSAYLGMWPKLRYVDVWYNLEASKNEASIDSERWHRDAEDLHILTLFLYLDDVGTDQGPFNYIKGSQRNGIYGDIASANPPIGSFPTNVEIFSHLPEDSVCTYIGKRGTAILCDTSGLHYGGRATKGRRLLLTARYFTCSGLDRIPYTLASDNKSHDLRIPFLLK